MIIQQVNRTDPDKVFIIARNVAATTTEIGDSCSFNFDLPNNAGVDVRTPSAAGVHKLQHFAGIWTEAKAQSEYGLIQCYGWNAVVKWSGGTTAGPGIGLQAVSGASSLASATFGVVDASLIVAIAGTTENIGNSDDAKPAFIKAMGI